MTGPATLVAKAPRVPQSRMDVQYGRAVGLRPARRTAPELLEGGLDTDRGHSRHRTGRGMPRIGMDAGMGPCYGVRRLGDTLSHSLEVPSNGGPGSPHTHYAQGPCTSSSMLCPTCTAGMGAH